MSNDGQATQSLQVIDTGSGTVLQTLPYPAPKALFVGLVFAPDGTRLVAADLQADAVSVVDLSATEPTQRATVPVGTHPNKVIATADGATPYVADGDSDEVSVLDTATGQVAKTISLAPYDGAPVGSNPDALALSRDGATLYVANAGDNDVAVVDPGADRVSGLIPTAWYPIAVVALVGKLFVANGKGLGAGPNTGPGHPHPYRGDTAPDQYVGSMMVGTLSTVDIPVERDQLRRWALGQLVDAVSHSPCWRSTAIFVTEDDAQNGPDHIGAHRTTAWVISPLLRCHRMRSCRVTSQSRPTRDFASRIRPSSIACWISSKFNRHAWMFSPSAATPPPGPTRSVSRTST